MKFRIIFRRRKIGNLKGKRQHFLENKQKAILLAEERICHFNKHYKFAIGKIRIKNQKSRWGSCSSKGNLNFNYKVVLLPEHLSDYIIVHELCHIGEFNHSRNFWNLVEQTIPDYMGARRELKKTRIC
jgi:predicted metal-dependent hydrolase